MQNQDAARILAFLREGLWDPKREKLNVAALPEELRPVGEELNGLARQIAEYREFAQAIAQGNLNAEAPRENRLCWPLKELRSNLSHLTWQTQQVAKGDYQQRVVFLGEFALSFNTMVRQLEVREKQLQQAADLIAARADRLEEANELMNQVISCTRDWMVVLDKNDHAVLFQNRPAEQLEQLCEGCTKECMDDFNRRLNAFLRGIRTAGEQQVDQMCNKALVVNSYEIGWGGHQALLHIITDVTRQREYDEELRGYAYTDSLTQLYNHRFCTRTVEDLIAAKVPFILCFADLDDLKQVNDRWGHPAGDSYLLAVVDAFHRCFRKEDTLCRIGGDEFVAVLRSCSEAVAVRRMEAVRALLRTDQERLGFPMDVSYGVTAVEGGTALSWQELLDEADEKMYRLKDQHKKTAAPAEGPAGADQAP